LLDKLIKRNKINIVMNTTTVTTETPLKPHCNPIQPPVATLLLPTATVQKCAITVIKCKVRNDIQWQVRFPEAGRVCRKFFPSEAQANAFAADQRGDALTNRQKLLLLPSQDLALLGVIYDEAQKRNLSLSRVLAMLETTQAGPVRGMAIQTVLAELVKELRSVHRDEKYVKNFEQIIKKFYRGQETKDIARFTVEDIMAFFAGKTAGYKKSLRTRLASLFGYAVRKKYRLDNPCAQLPVIHLKKMPPAVLSLTEAKTCLEWFLKNPKGLAWFVLSAFAGLRPQDESCFTGWDKINFEAACIVVEAEVCKTHKRRVVYPEPMVFAWLKRAKELEAQLPLSLEELSTIQRKLRVVLGWPEWKQDVTRHSAASYWLAKTNDVKKVSRSCGHSVAVLESDYDARVFEADGKAYFDLTPEALKT
jgi:hypothetical protein